MNAESIQQLESLLQQALNAVVLSDGRSTHTDLTTYRVHLGKHLSGYNPSSTDYVKRYSPDVYQNAIRESILDFLRGELEQYIYGDKIYAASFGLYGGPPKGFHIESVLSNLLKRAILYGPTDATHALHECIGRSYASFQHFSLLTGVHVEESIQVFDRVWLVPLPNSTEGLPNYLPRFFEFTEVNFLSKTVLQIESQVSPVFHKPVTGEDDRAVDVRECFTTTINSRDIPSLMRGKFCQALSLACNAAAQSAMDWNYMRDDEIFNISPSMGFFTYSQSAMLQTFPTLISRNEVDEAKRIYSALINLEEETYKALEIPIRRWMSSKTEMANVDKMIDLGIAFESLYLAGRNDEVSFTFRLRASWYLGKDENDRKDLLKKFNQIYGSRSKAVHSGDLPPNTTYGQQSIPTREFIEHAQDLCRQSILKAIGEGKVPDGDAWDSIVVGRV